MVNNRPHDGPHNCLSIVNYSKMLKEQIIKDLTEAMKARDELKTGALRMLKAAIMNYEVSGVNKVATDDVVVDLVKKAIKQRREAAEGFEKGGNKESAQKELDEMIKKANGKRTTTGGG